MTVGILTSSRADYSIYLPLLKEIQKDTFFQLEIIAFGTHLSFLHGNTIQAIEADGFDVKYQIETPMGDDSPNGIVRCMGKTMIEFSDFWNAHKFDLVFALGDRYEMFAACASSVPFGIKLAHLHGGEQTIGAIDDVFRHSITHMSSLHFAATENYRQRIVDLKNSDFQVYNVGALSIDNLKSLCLLSVDDFFQQFRIDLRIPTILITFHPETVSFSKNVFYVKELIDALWQINDYQFVFTMPNADTSGNMIREAINEFISAHPMAVGVESFGTLGYLSCMKHCAMMLGNTSSGFIEASFFSKYVINLGERQKGRMMTENIYNCPIDQSQIVDAVNRFSTIRNLSIEQPYGDGETAKRIVDIIKLLS